MAYNQNVKHLGKYMLEYAGPTGHGDQYEMLIVVLFGEGDRQKARKVFYVVREAKRDFWDNIRNEDDAARLWNVKEYSIIKNASVLYGMDGCLDAKALEVIDKLKKAARDVAFIYPTNKGVEYEYGTGVGLDEAISAVASVFNMTGGGNGHEIKK